METENLSEKGGGRGVRMVCAWCNKDMGEKDGKGVEGVSHGLCQECFDRMVLEAENGLMLDLLIAEDAEER